MRGLVHLQQNKSLTAGKSMESTSGVSHDTYLRVIVVTPQFLNYFQACDIPRWGQLQWCCRGHTEHSHAKRRTCWEAMVKNGSTSSRPVP